MTFISTHKEKTAAMLLAFGISLFGALFLWNFWSYGINVLGINSLVYGFLFIAFFIYVKREILSAKSLYWLIPLSLICLSMGIYTNDFTKSISLFLLPLIFFIFTTHEARKEMRHRLWSRFILIELAFSMANYLSSVFEVFGLFKFKKKPDSELRLSPEKRNLAIQIGLGVLILFVLAGIIIIPLLSSADSQFGSLFEGIMQIIGNLGDYIWKVVEYIFGASFFSRLILTLIGMMLLLGYGLYWSTQFKGNPVAAEEEEKERFGKKYSIMISIILSGVLALYLIFIVLQIKTLFVGSLPVNFAQTENLVKTGFWQLFLLTLINILFYTSLFQKSTKGVQNILGAFTFASLLLIVSAAHRTYLYVATYGLSYEKFYAFYTVIFCIGVFVWFLYLFVGKGEKPEILRNLAFASLWMYALTTIVPLEKIIFSTNLSLTQQADSRININELQMLGFDALSTIEKNFDLLIVESKKDHFAQVEKWLEQDASIPEDVKVEWLTQDMNEEWKLWMTQVKEKSEILNYNYRIDGDFGYKPEDKRWYEKTISELIY